MSRPDARNLAIRTLSRLPERVDLSDVYLYPEVIGKVVQFGSLEDVLSICTAVPFCRPCVDFGHLHARTLGGLTSQEAFARVFDLIEERLGVKAYEGFHCHMYPIEWGENGEIRHRSFQERRSITQLSLLEATPPSDLYLPRPEPFVRELASRQMSGVVICEAKNTQETGALLMKRLYEKEIATA